MSRPLTRKEAGAFYTPDPVVGSLLRWAVRAPSDRLLDPSCGDGNFIAGHRNSVGIEQDAREAQIAMGRAPWALVHEGDFFAWCGETQERFDCATGNPPFIRYQSFKGEVRARALAACARLGANFSGLASSWAPFLVATAGLLRPGGRMAFVVPAEIGHAPYAAPLLEFLVGHFSTVHVVAVRDKLFPALSEDCWLLHADGFGGTTPTMRFTARDKFGPCAEPPADYVDVPVAEWRASWDRRLRPYLLRPDARAAYLLAGAAEGARCLGEVASVSIGYVSGANDFFHLRPSEADKLGIPQELLHASVRNGRSLPTSALVPEVVHRWCEADDPVLLLRLPKAGDLPPKVRDYLDGEAGRTARQAYKCRVREPWYAVPDVQVPDFFLSYMSGLKPSLVRNQAGCTCTNSVHTVRLRPGFEAGALQSWNTPFVALSCELQGHPLGGGMLKLEPREATRVVLPPTGAADDLDGEAVADAVRTMRSWRHYGEAA